MTAGMTAGMTASRAARHEGDSSPQAAPRPACAGGQTLAIRSWNGGFFSNFNGVLNNLRWRLGRHGVAAAKVDWRADPARPDFPYGRPEDGNLWLHFFEPLPFERFPEGEREARAFARLDITYPHTYATYKLDRRWRYDYHALYRRHIRIRPAILERVEAIHRARMAGRYCVGVHYRHPAHDRECLHPIPPAEAFIERLRRMLPVDRPHAVVLATDTEFAVEAFRAAFGERLVLQPGVHRATGAPESHPQEVGLGASLALGEQVLIDCLLLARCDALLHVSSNIATAAGYINPKLEMVYCETPAQAAWGYAWSLLLARTGIVWLANWLPLALRAALRRLRGRNLRWLRAN
jgi:hypothetical protein